MPKLGSKPHRSRPALVISTLTITEPSFKWRLTLRPICERAMFKSILHMFSPFYVLVRDFSPATTTEWQNLVLVVDVDFDVAVGASAVPRILT